MSTPTFDKVDSMEISTSHVEESPQHLTSLQFSPEGFAFPLSGPATAPVHPQHKLFWDPSQSADAMNIDFPMDDTFTAFGIGMQKNLDPFASPQGQSSGIQFPASPDFSLLGNRGSDVAAFTSSSNKDSFNRTVTSTIRTRKPFHGKLAGNVVNPSLLFSSPGRAPESTRKPSSSQAPHDEALQPYAHQIRDAEMEKEIEKVRKPKRKRGPESDSPAVKAALKTLREDQCERLGINRVIIDSCVDDVDKLRPRSRNSSGHLKQIQLPGQESLKKQRSNNDLQIQKNKWQPHKRASVTLTIDASGRAKTEAKFVDDDAAQSSRCRTETDSEDNSESSSSSSSAGIATSQIQSFVYPTQKYKQPKLGRFVSDPKSHSQRSSYASTLGSGGTINASSEMSNRRPSSHLCIQQNAQDPSRIPYFGNGEEDLGSEAETVINSEDDRGDAQSELKKVIYSRAQKKISKQSKWPGPNNSLPEQRRAYRPQAGPAHPYYVSESLPSGLQGYPDPYSDISPTTITDPDLTAPSTGRSSNISSDNTRCVCHSTSDYDGQLMIQW